jgi:hypothetical protein
MLRVSVVVAQNNANKVPSIVIQNLQLKYCNSNMFGSCLGRLQGVRCNCVCCVRVYLQELFYICNQCTLPEVDPRKVESSGIVICYLQIMCNNIVRFVLVVLCNLFSQSEQM